MLVGAVATTSEQQTRPFHRPSAAKASKQSTKQNWYHHHSRLALCALRGSHVRDLDKRRFGEGLFWVRDADADSTQGTRGLFFVLLS